MTKKGGWGGVQESKGAVAQLTKARHKKVFESCLQSSDGCSLATKGTWVRGGDREKAIHGGESFNLYKGGRLMLWKTNEAEMRHLPRRKGNVDIFTISLSRGGGAKKRKRNTAQERKAKLYLPVGPIGHWPHRRMGEPVFAVRGEERAGFTRKGKFPGFKFPAENPLEGEKLTRKVWKKGEQ